MVVVLVLVVVVVVVVGGGYEGTFGSMCRAPFVLKKSFIFLISLIL